MEVVFSNSTTLSLFFLKNTGKHTIDFQRRLEDKTLGTTMEQIVRMLIRLAETYGVQLIHTNEILLNEVFHNTELANMIGMTRETISRNMKILYQKKVIRKDKRGRLILHMKRINKLK